jgi:hypothetical protein
MRIASAGTGLRHLAVCRLETCVSQNGESKIEFGDGVDPKTRPGAFRELQDAHLDAAWVSVALAVFAEREDQIGSLPFYVPDNTVFSKQRLDTEALERLVAEGLWRKGSDGYQILDDETLNSARAGIRESQDEYVELTKVCKARRHHIIQVFPVGSDEEGDTVCEDCARCVCTARDSCGFPHTANEMILFDLNIGRGLKSPLTEPRAEPVYRAVPFQAETRERSAHLVLVSGNAGAGQSNTGGEA